MVEPYMSRATRATRLRCSSHASTHCYSKIPIGTRWPIQYQTYAEDYSSSSTRFTQYSNELKYAKGVEGHRQGASAIRLGENTSCATWPRAKNGLDRASNTTKPRLAGKICIPARLARFAAFITKTTKKKIARTTNGGMQQNKVSQGHEPSKRAQGEKPRCR